jgi:hypothetical protein
MTLWGKVRINKKDPTSVSYLWPLPRLALLVSRPTNAGEVLFFLLKKYHDQEEMQWKS